MKYVMDLYLKQGYIVDVLDETGANLDIDAPNPPGRIPDFEIYGDMGKQKNGTEDFFFILNGRKYYAINKPKELMVSLELKNGYRILVSRKTGLGEHDDTGRGALPIDINQLKWNLWEKKDDGHLADIGVSIP